MALTHAPKFWWKTLSTRHCRWRDLGFSCFASVTDCRSSTTETTYLLLLLSPSPHSRSDENFERQNARVRLNYNRSECKRIAYYYFFPPVSFSEFINTSICTTWWYDHSSTHTGMQQVDLTCALFFFFTIGRFFARLLST